MDNQSIRFHGVDSCLTCQLLIRKINEKLCHYKKLDQIKFINRKKYVGKLLKFISIYDLVMQFVTKYDDILMFSCSMCRLNGFES